MTENPEIVVIGSINIDLVARVPRIPQPGETVLGKDLLLFPGGKGANQAVGAARLGAKTALVGRVGDDPFGNRLIAGLEAAAVDTRGVLITPGVASGAALITVDHDGENAIAVASGANSRVTPHDIDHVHDLIATARVCLLQLELPIETVIHAIRVCRNAGVETILDYAPAIADPPAGLLNVDILTANLEEAARLSGERFAAHGEHKVALAAIGALGPSRVVVKLGNEGAVWLDGERFDRVAAHRIVPVDTTAAGDAFTAALGVARSRGEPLTRAVRYANASGAAACLKMGAQPSLPTPVEVEHMLKHP